MSEEIKVIKVGSRKSELALIQTKHVISLLQTIYTKHKFEIKTMSTMGDRILNISLPKIGEKSLFTKDLEDALCNGDVDFVVHSLKDLPTQLPANLCIGAVLEREDPRDALVLNKKYEGSTLSTLPVNSIIGTSSLRRTAQLKNHYPQLIVEDIRGNLNTRLAKLDDPNSKYAGIILAQAGLVRMGWQHRISQTLDPDTTLLYAVGQGALAVECCVNNMEILNILKNLICLHTQCQVLIERSFLKKLGGGCSAPVGINTSFKKLQSNKHTINNDNKLYETTQEDERSFTVDVNGGVWSLDGQKEVLCKVTSTMALIADININVIKSLQNNKLVDTVDDELISIDKKKIKLNVNEEPPSNQIMDFMKVHQNVFKDEKILDNPDQTIKKQCPMKMTTIGNEEMVKCPFLRKNTLPTMNNDNQVNDPSIAAVKCPLNLGIGEDIMAECPVYNVQQKIDANLQIPHHHHQKSPLSLIHSSFDRFSTINENTTVQSGTGDINRIEDDNHHHHHHHQLTDKHDELNEDKIFCGIYHHNCYDVNLLKKCVNLGYKLANDLIEKGALIIMKSAQNEIRSKD